MCALPIRPGVTNREIHHIVWRHVVRFVPALRIAAFPGVGNATDVGAGGMAVDGSGTQEAGISSTR